MADFDRLDEDSPFFSFVASEFQRRGTAKRLELSKKSTSHPFVKDLGMSVPARLATLHELEGLDFSKLPEKFVLKFARGWSSRGVMLLERTADGTYFDHMNLRECTPEYIIQAQSAVAKSFGGRSVWLVEEFLESTVPVGKAPFDYKFYCFDGTVALIAQYDRNAYPPRCQIFDGSFRPLRHGRDYVIVRTNLQGGPPVVPLNAPEMLWWAQYLSTQVDAPFVSVDMYDTPGGPVFGEFTYSPGAVHKRMFLLSREIIDGLDGLIEGKDARVGSSEISLEQLKRFARPPLRVFGTLAAYSYNSGPRGALRLAELYREYGRLSIHAHERAWMKRLAGIWQGIGERARSQLRRQSTMMLEQSAKEGAH
ncbi:ATP-grasp fold amidoligase family protein [Luteimonas sp. JM171]|uniref:ATP-grasp fold amidoligase family protein n=1 Tax=Luteimonas sp. JM171 TaxID=1896164 RepID=UPI000BA458BB|nr:ATP-grasp fold amidoligase family protein [Luteimonas sp. JM171]